MKTVRACIETYELDLRTLVWTRGRCFLLSSLETRLRCPRWRITARDVPAADFTKGTGNSAAITRTLLSQGRHG